MPPNEVRIGIANERLSVGKTWMVLAVLVAVRRRRSECDSSPLQWGGGELHGYAGCICSLLLTDVRKWFSLATARATLKSRIFFVRHIRFSVAAGFPNLP